MENDVQSKNVAILNMKVWIERNKYNIYSSTMRNPLPITCRNSVHTQEIMCRLLKGSPILDSKSEVAPVHAAYVAVQQYRVDTFTRALRIHDSMKIDNIEGTSPMYRPKQRNIVARRKEKEDKSITGPLGEGMLP